MAAVSRAISRFDGYILHVYVHKTGRVRLYRIVSAKDCGTSVNPDSARAMSERQSNSASLEQSNVKVPGASNERCFRDGVSTSSRERRTERSGRTGAPPLAPAVATAIFTGTRKRIRRPPIGPAFLTSEEPQASSIVLGGSREDRGPSPLQPTKLRGIR